MNLIKEALSRGQLSLSEYYSKRFFSHFGIPVSREAIALDADSVEKSIKEHIKIASALYSRDIIPAKKCLSSRRLMRNLRQSRSVQKLHLTCVQVISNHSIRVITFGQVTIQYYRYSIK